MKNKASLPLMEQLLMVLVFSLTAAICIQGFALAKRLSQHQETRDQAVIRAQNAAEILKHTSGNYEAAASLLGAYREQEAWLVCYDASWQPLSSRTNAEYLLSISPLETDSSLLGSARICITADEELLFELTTAWQEENDHDTIQRN